MTLALANKTKGRVVFVADTRISEHNKPLPIEKGIVKTVVINDDLAVAYSGSPELAAQIIQTLSDFNEIPIFKQLKDTILPLSIDYGVDILITTNAKSPRLFVVKDGEIHARNTAWIGDYEAFRAYQGYRTGALSASKHQAEFITRTARGSKDFVAPLLEIIDSLKNVVVDPAVTSVGGLVTAIMNDDSRFQHIPYSEIFYSRFCEAIAPGLSKTLSADGEDREYQHSVMVALNTDVPAIGFYFMEPQKLFIFSKGPSGLMTEVKILSNITSESLNNPNEVCGYSFDYVLMAHGPDTQH